MNQEVKTINGYNIKDEKAIRTYDTVALMQADSKLSEGQHVKTRGYYEINDGGDAYYKIRNITENDSVTDYDKIFLNNGLIAEFINPNFDFVNPLQFGAKGDNVTDDSAIIRYALKYKKLRITKQHLISTPITGLWEVTIIGERASQNGNHGELNFDTGNNYGLIVDGYCLIENLIIKGEKCLKIYKWNNIIRNNQFIGNEESSSDNAIKFGSDVVWFGENIVEYNTFKNFNIAIDCYTETTVASDEYINNNIIIACGYFIKGVFGATFIRENHDYSENGILLYGNDNMIENNYFDNGTNTSIKIQSFNHSLSISNNLFLVIEKNLDNPAEDTTCVIINDIGSDELTNCLSFCNNRTSGKREDVVLLDLNWKKVYGVFEGNKAPQLYKQVNFNSVINSKGLCMKGTATFISNGTQQKIKTYDGKIKLDLSIPQGDYSASYLFTHNLTQIERDYYFTFYHSTGTGVGKFRKDGNIQFLYPYTFTDPVVDCIIDCGISEDNYNTFS